MSKILETAKDLMQIESIASKPENIRKALDYCKNYFPKDQVFIKEFDDNGNISPAMVITNCDSVDLDVLLVGHVDVVPGAPEMFKPVVKDGILHGRGSLDMKAQIAIGLELMKHVLESKLSIKIGLLIGSDEETGGHGAYYIANKTDVRSKIVLDPDIGGNINHVAYRCKNTNFVTLTAKGVNAHGSQPWLAVDAIELLMQTINNLRSHIPYYSSEGETPKDTWIRTMHVGTIKGGSAVNVISNHATAEIDFRWVEDNVDGLKEILDKSVVPGVTYDMGKEGILVEIDEKNEHLQSYIKIAKKYVGDKVEMIGMGGATDARNFAQHGSTIIMHSITGEGMHSDNEFSKVEDLDTLLNCYKDFLNNL